MIEYIVPCNNEDEFISVAERLGISELCFLYDLESFLAQQDKKREYKTKIKIKQGILADHKNYQKIKQKIKDKTVPIIIKSSLHDRAVIESGKVDIVFGFEEQDRKDFMHQRASGLNQVMCKLMKAKEIAMGVSYSSLITSDEAHLLLGRIKQNLVLCRKYNVDVVIASFSDEPYLLRSSFDVKGILH